MKIKVLKKHITAAIKNKEKCRSPLLWLYLKARTQCPIALALKERFPRQRVIVHGGFWMDIGGKAYEAKDSAITTAFIRKFDNTGEAKPVTFEIERQQ